MFLAVIACALFATAFAAKVTSIPGFNEPFGFESYSGYVDVDESPHTKHMFYWLVGAEGADFETAPTVLWLTGGPGCSSLLALFTENGPFRHSEESVFELVRNNYSWNKAGVNMLFLESPVGVGFSWAEDGNYTTGDNETARVSQLFLRGFFQQFPQLAKNDFYISGESYAGHYVPQLAQAVVEANKADPAHALNLKGWIVGNPSWGFTDPSLYWEFMAEHAIVSRADFKAADKTCNGTFSGSFSPACAVLLERMRNQTIGINPYDVIGTCIGRPSDDGGCFTAQATADTAAHWDGRSDVVSASGARGLAQTFVPCVNLSGTEDYLAQLAVREALHVAPQALGWQICSQVVQYKYFAPTVAPIYEALAPSHRVLVYSGDVDSCVPFPGTEDAVEALGFPRLPGHEWEAWKVDGQIAGFLRAYDTGAAGAMAWTSVRGAGHMVPTYRPAQAFAMLDGYIRGELPPRAARGGST